MTYLNHLDDFAEQVSIVNEFGELFTYTRLLKYGDDISSIVGCRCLIFIICSNSVESVAAYLGCLRAGVVPVLLSRSLAHGLLFGLMESYRPSFVFAPTIIVEQLPSVQEVFRLNSYSLVATDYEVDYELHDELALLLTTSGSTGSPKLVRQSYYNIRSNTESIISYLNITSMDRAITTLPMNYTYGLSIITTHLVSGASIVLTESSLMRKEFWSLLRDEKVSTFGGVPYIYEMLKKLRFEKMETPSLRYLTQAGGRLDSALMSDFYNICSLKGIQFIVMYGQTEATARMSWLPWEQAPYKCESIGIPVPGGKFWLANDELKPIEKPGIVGELVYEGPNVTLGYAESRHDLYLGDERGGRLFTGDMAKYDSDGFYYLAGRKKRFLKLYGSRINLDEIESLLGREGFSCVCAGSDDNLKVFMEGNEKERVMVEKYLGGCLVLNRAGFKVVLIEALPRNDAGKIQYSALPL